MAVTIRLASALLFLVACKEDAPPPAQPGDVVVTNAGLPPRRLLRYALPAGTKTTFELAVDTDLTAAGLGGAMPTIAFTFELVVDDVQPDGRMHVKTIITDVGARDRDDAKVAAANVQAAVEGLRDAAIVATLQPDGRLVDARVDHGVKSFTDTQEAQLQPVVRSFEQLAMPLPRVPIGSGARWTSTRPLELEGMQVTSTTTVDVIAVSDHVLAFTAKTDLHGPDQQVTLDSMAVDVSKLYGTGASRGTIDLSRLAITATFESSLHAEMRAGGEETPIDLAMKIETAPR